jgi:hypothetical protein
MDSLCLQILGSRRQKTDQGVSSGALARNLDGGEPTGSQPETVSQRCCRRTARQHVAVS